MHARRLASLTLVLAAALGACAAPGSDHGQDLAAEASFARLAAMQGEWVDADGTMTTKGAVFATYKVSAGGSAVIETLFPGQAEEMVTVYTREGDDIVLTHYCLFGNQPRMRATKLGGNVLHFEFEGGGNLDPARDDHMHSGRLEFLSDDEVRTEWEGWTGGKPDSDHKASVYLVRKSG